MCNELFIISFFPLQNFSSSILRDIQDNCPQLSDGDLLALRNILPVATNRHSARYLNQVSHEFYAKLPESVRNIVQKWSSFEIHAKNLESVSPFCESCMCFSARVLPLLVLKTRTLW